MPYATGTASKFSDFAVVGEIIANGNGVQTSFNVDIVEEKAQIGSFVGDYVIGVTSHSFTTDEDGNITGTDLTGTFDGKTADYTFASAPSGDIVVDYISQGALSQVIDFATNRKTKTQVIGTGDGVQTVFNFNLSDFPVADGQCLIRARMGGAFYLVYPQSGIFDHPQITGTINQATGVGSITTASPVDDTIDIEAIYNDSVTPGQDWIFLREETTRGASGGEEYPGELLKQVWIKNSGFSGKVNNNGGGITIAFREAKITASNAFGIQGNFWKDFTDFHFVSTSFISNSTDIGGSFLASGVLQNMPSLNCAENNVVWFCSSTKNHIFICVRSLGTIYGHIAQGCGNPLSSFLLYPRPFFSKGNSSTIKPLSDNASTFNSITKSGTTEGKYIRPDGSVNTGLSGYDIFPRDRYVSSQSLKNTKNNKVLLRAVVVHDVSSNNTLFAIPGVKFCPSTQLEPEFVIRNQDLIDHDVFIEHNNVEDRSFFCVDKAL